MPAPVSMRRRRLSPIDGSPAPARRPEDVARAMAASITGESSGSSATSMTPEEVSERLSMMRNAPAARPEDGEDASPSTRMQEVLRSAPEYEREYTLGLVHRLLQRKVPLDQIARQLDLSIRQVQRYRSELMRQLKAEVSRLDINELIGRNMAYLDEVRAMSLRIGTNSETPLGVRLHALRTGVMASKEQTSFLQSAGVFEVLKFQAEKDNGDSSVNALLQIAERVLNTIDDEEDQMVGMLDPDEHVRLL